MAAPASKSAVSLAVKLGALFKGGVFYGDLSTDIYFAVSVYGSDGGADSDRIGVFTAVVVCILLFPIVTTIVDVATKAKGGMGWFGGALNLTFTRILCVHAPVLPPVLGVAPACRTCTCTCTAPLSPLLPAPGQSCAPAVRVSCITTHAQHLWHSGTGVRVLAAVAEHHHPFPRWPGASLSVCVPTLELGAGTRCRSS